MNIHKYMYTYISGSNRPKLYKLFYEHKDSLLCLHLSVALGTESRASSIQNKYSINKLYSWPQESVLIFHRSMYYYLLLEWLVVLKENRLFGIHRNA